VWIFCFTSPLKNNDEQTKVMDGVEQRVLCVSIFYEHKRTNCLFWYANSAYNMDFNGINLCYICKLKATTLKNNVQNE
jgi:hypothetical protein